MFHVKHFIKFSNCFRICLIYDIMKIHFSTKRQVLYLKKKLTTGAILIATATVTIHVINKIVFYLSTIDNHLSKQEGNSYEWRFGNIFYQKQGEGSPILLVHDLNAHSSGYEWRKTAALLAEKHTVYTIDLLGCGRSDKPNCTYTNFLYVQLINDFIKNVIGEKTDVIATGESASFVTMACGMGENLIGKIAMVNPLSFAELATVPSKRTKSLKLLIQLPIIGTLLYNILQSKRCIEETFQTKYFYNIGKIEDTAIKIYCESAHTGNTHSKYLFASIKGRYTKANILPCIEKLTNSMFIISGTLDPFANEIAEQYQKHVPAIEVVSVDETGYLPQMEAPDKFVEQIEIFFAVE